MIKYNNLKSVIYNQIGKIKYNSRLPRKESLYNRLAGAIPVVYAEDGARLGVLENADEVILEQEIGSVDILTFVLPFNDAKREYIKNENIVELVDNRYIIRNVRKVRSGGSLELEVYCEA